MRTKTQPLFPSIVVVLAIASTFCGPVWDDGPHEGPDHHHWKRPDRPDRPQPGQPGCDAGTNPAPDAGVIIPPPDAGAVEPPDSGVVEQPDSGVVEVPDAGGGETPDAGIECPPEGCPCTRDNDCPEDQICNHPLGLCEPIPVACRDLTSEADCLGRTDCQPVYAGMNCRDPNGGECVSGDTDCTCETYSFAVCIDHL